MNEELENKELENKAIGSGGIVLLKDNKFLKLYDTQHIKELIKDHDVYFYLEKSNLLEYTDNTGEIYKIIKHTFYNVDKFLVYKPVTLEEYRLNTTDKFRYNNKYYIDVSDVFNVDFGSNLTTYNDNTFEGIDKTISGLVYIDKIKDKKYKNYLFGYKMDSAIEDGHTELTEFMRKATNDEEYQDVLLDKLKKTIEYFNNNNVLGCDFQPSNIFFNTSDTSKPLIMIDIGEVGIPYKNRNKTDNCKRTFTKLLANLHDKHKRKRYVDGVIPLKSLKTTVKRKNLVYLLATLRYRSQSNDETIQCQGEKLNVDECFYKKYYKRIIDIQKENKSGNISSNSNENQNMDISVYDFLPKYPNIVNTNNEILNPYDDDFYEVIYKKKEFYENKLSPTENIPTEKGGQLMHQKNLSKFISEYTLYNNILLFHEMGTGKTCSAVGIIESIRSNKNSGFKGALYISKGETLHDNFINELMFKCTDGRYVPDDYDDLSQLEKSHRRNKIISKFYSLKTFETFAKFISNKSDSSLQNDYNNHIVIIDEVHNLRLRESGQSGLNTYKQIHRFLHVVQNCKILLMSGTPMKDSVNEIASVMNLILPINNQFVVDDEFNKLYLTKEGNT
jgi:hypothetical protein